MDGPFQAALDQLPTQGVYKHSLVTYKYLNGVLVRTVTTRRYTNEGDYTDTFESEPIGRGSSV